MTTATVAKLSKGERVSLEVLERICAYFNCRIEDVIEYVPEEKSE
jgi:DNA-binding Xre family transcriptional regulator